MLLQRKERLQLLYQNLAAAPPAATRTEALDLIQRLMREVEEAHSGLPEIPTCDNGRMCPPVEKQETDVPDKPQLKRYRHTWHYTLIADNGSFLIRRFLFEKNADGKLRKTGKEETEFSKAGEDGKSVEHFEKN